VLTGCFVCAVTVTIKARKVTVKGERGEVTKDFSHLACELQKMKQDSKKRKGVYIRIRMWFGGTKQACAVKTLVSLLSNMITGVTEVSNFVLSHHRDPPPAFHSACCRGVCVLDS